MKESVSSCKDKKKQHMVVKSGRRIVYVKGLILICIKTTTIYHICILHGLKLI